MRLIVPDLISPSYFPAIAAVELGCIAEHGVEVELDLVFPVTEAVQALRRGEVQVVAGAAHALFHDAEDGGGVRLLAALSRHMYWFLVVRTDAGLSRSSDLKGLEGLRIGAAPGPDAGLVQMLVDAGVDVDSVDIGPVPGTSGAGVSFGVTAADALADGLIDGFWANGMGAEVAVRRGDGVVLIDVRRGDGPPPAKDYTFASLMSTDDLIQEQPAALRAVVAGLVEAQARLRADPEVAGEVADGLFPAVEAELAPALIERDAPFYSPEITEPMVGSMVAFARERAFTTRTPGADELVASLCRDLWREPDR